MKRIDAVKILQQISCTSILHGSINYKFNNWGVTEKKSNVQKTFINSKRKTRDILPGKELYDMYNS